MDSTSAKCLGQNCKFSLILRSKHQHLASLPKQLTEVVFHTILSDQKVLSEVIYRYNGCTVSLKPAIRVSDFPLEINCPEIVQTVLKQFSYESLQLRAISCHPNCSLRFNNHLNSATTAVTIGLVWASSSLTFFMVHKRITGTGKDPAFINEQTARTNLRKSHTGPHCTSSQSVLS